MPIEIEHKFLVANDKWRNQTSHSIIFQQGYLSGNPASSIRVRISDTNAWLNIKSATVGSQRQEYEYPIPLADAHEILAHLCTKPIIKKIRHYLPQEQHTWEIDEFEDENQGLIVAEIELSYVNEPFYRPAWLGKEVTDDLRYYNNNLAKNPYTRW